MKIGMKIFSGFLAVVLLMAISGGISIYLLRDIRNSSDITQNERLPLLLKTNQLAVNSGLKVAAARGYVITGNDNFMSDYDKLDKMDDAIIQELIDKAISEKGKQLVRESKSLDDAYQKILFEKVVPLKKAGKMDEAISVMVNELAPAATATRAKIDENIKFRETRINEDFDNNQAQMDKAQWTIIGFFVLALIIAAVIATYVTRGITRPLQGAVGFLTKMSEGDFALNIRDQFLNARDETGEMARAMDKMIGTMKGTIRKLAASAEQLAAASEELTASSEQSAQAANQIATSITEVANGAGDQLAAANDASAIVEQMSAGIQQVAANTNQVADQSVQAAEKAKEGGKGVEKAINQMVQIENTVNTSAQVVSKLGERSKEIGQIVDTISGIAGQTNLLALNAAIEAARAGEQGRGFAVVAEEVRKLAEQSQEAAKKIAELIGEIQGDTDKAVIAMNEGTREVRNGAEAVNAAGLTFREIVELVSQVSGQVREISAAIQQMASGSQQIVNSVKKIDMLSKGAAGETQSVSAATEEQLASMEEIATSSQALATLAQDLQLEVAKFRV